ncbi:MAG: hypothetical protein Q8M58_10990 [Anaerolineales bacterium]|nr:hypothetical protein [Anaerolineales bacterium]
MSSRLSVMWGGMSSRLSVIWGGMSSRLSACEQDNIPLHPEVHFF